MSDVRSDHCLGLRGSWQMGSSRSYPFGRYAVVWRGSRGSGLVVDFGGSRTVVFLFAPVANDVGLGNDLAANCPAGLGLPRLASLNMQHENDKTKQL